MNEFLISHGIQSSSFRDSTSFFIIFFLFPHIFYSLLFGLWVHQVFQVTIADLLSSPTPAPSNLLLDLNMNLNPETMMHDDVNTVKHRQPDTLYKPMLFEPLR